MTAVFASLLFIASGLILGSFAGCLSWRVPRGLYPLGFSVCPTCENRIPGSSLIPVLSWVLQKGRCRSCGVPVSADYALIEGGCALAALAVYWTHGLTLEAAFLVALIPLLAALLAIDLRHLILPNALVLAVGILGLARLAAGPSHLVLPHLAAAVLGAGGVWILGAVMGKILKKPALGFGDVKFFCVAGLWLGLSALPYFMMGAGFFGVAFGLVWTWRKGRGEPFPFGPALIASLFLILLLGPTFTFPS